MDDSMADTMVSGWMIGGIVTAFLVCTALVLGAFVTYFRKRGNVQGTFFVLILGMIGVIFTQNIADVVASLIKLPALMEQSYLLAMLVYGILIALIDMLFRLYFIGFIGRGGMGKVRATVLSCGYVSGQCLMPTFSLFMYITYAVMINQGIFLDGLEVGSDAYLAAAEFQKELTGAPGLMYYTAASEYLAKAALHCFITMALVRGILEGKKAKSFGILFGVRAAYEVGYQLIYAFCSKDAGRVYDESTALTISLIFSIAVLAASIYVWKKVMTDYPVSKEPQNKQKAGRQSSEEEQRKKSLAWQEVRNMNRPANIGRKTEVIAATEVPVTDGAVREDVETSEDEKVNALVQTETDAEQDDTSGEE